MKKYLSVLIAALLILSCLTGCGSKTNTNEASLQIVTTIFPEYDWVRNILGENPSGAEVTMLLDNGADLHSYQPTANDMLKISTCDIFIYVGGESDEWVDDALAEASNQDMIAIDLLEVLGDAVKAEEVVEGMEYDHGHDHEEGELEEDEHDEHEHEGEVEWDEHVWLSLRNAEVIVQAISEALQTVDPENASVYRSNTDSYIAKLQELDQEYEAAVAGASVKTLLFGDRFPFRYLTDDYGLSYYAAFVGCSAETEASFETITFLAQKVDELGLHTVLTIEGPDHSIAETIVESTSGRDQRILTMDSMQSTTSTDVENGATYLSVMEANLEVLKEALK